MLGAAHVVISCLRLVAFMYNRQQKWLYEQNLPDLAMLRRVLRLGPQRVGEDVSPRGSSVLLAFCCCCGGRWCGCYCLLIPGFAPLTEGWDSAT